MTAAVIVRRCALLLACLLILLPLPGQRAAAANQPPDRQSGMVTWVHDADTLEIEPHGKVRLIGIDAPEKTSSSRDDKFIALGASALTLRAIHKEGLTWSIRTVKGRKVTLGFDRTRRDRHGRLLAYVYLEDGRLLNRLLLEEGLVIVYRRFPFERKSEFISAETAARQRRNGLWRRPPGTDVGSK